MGVLGDDAVTGVADAIVRREPPAARVTLNRPEKRNALSLELMREVTSASCASSGPTGTSGRS